MATNVPPPVTCYIAGAMSAVPPERRDELSTKRKAIAKFFQDGYSITCSHYKVLTAQPEATNPTQEELQSIVARDLILVNSAEVIVLCYEGKKIYSWGAAIELGYAYGCGKTIVIFNLTNGEEDTYFFLKYLPQDAEHKVYIVTDKKSLNEFTDKYKCERTETSEEEVKKAKKELEKVIF